MGAKIRYVIPEVTDEMKQNAKQPDIPEGYKPEEITKEGKGIPKGKAQAGTSGSGRGVMGAAPPEPTSSSPTTRTLAPNLEQLRAEGIRGVGGSETGPTRVLEPTNPLEPTPNQAGRARVINTGGSIPNTANLSPNARMALGGGAGVGAAGAGLLGAGVLPVVTAGLGTGLAAYGVTRQLIKDIPGLEKGIEGIGEAIHGPIREAVQPEAAPDLNVMGTNVPGGADVPSPAANPKSPSKTDQQTDLLAQAKPSPPNSPIDQSQFTGPTGKGVNYNLDNAGNMVPEGVADTNPYDKELMNVLTEMKYLSGLIVPARSGYIGDTIAENFDIFDRQKKLEKIANVLQPLTTEGMKLAAKGVPAPLHPVIEGEKRAATRYHNAQAEALETDDTADEKTIGDWEKEKRKGRVELIKESPDMTEASLNTELDRRYPEPIKKKYRLKDPERSHIEVQRGVTGTVKFFNTKTGKYEDAYKEEKGK